jgi:hypothetical protein
MVMSSFGFAMPTLNAEPAMEAPLHEPVSKSDHVDLLSKGWAVLSDDELERALEVALECLCDLGDAAQELERMLMEGKALSGQIDPDEGRGGIPEDDLLRGRRGRVIPSVF